MLNTNPNPKKVKRATEDGRDLTQRYWRKNDDGTETEYEVPLYRCLPGTSRVEAAKELGCRTLGRRDGYDAIDRGLVVAAVYDEGPESPLVLA